MKLNNWILLGTTSFILATHTPSVHGQTIIDTSAANGVVATSQKQATKAVSGSFRAREKPATGKAMIVREGGHSFLVLDSAFSTSDQGPDLHVLLDSSANPPKNYAGATQNRVINLGKLKSYSGEQRYPIPDSVNLSNVKSVIIWCRMANATFAYAPLGSK